ncbi:inositol monophosphatase family protein [Zymobacter sp. IVIA_5232.4 C2]|uniref:inositol monophosphatase family protein n=1 Tax=Zymobacter sp. IVIA_5232.4 C2 TaxID=3394855 RepID=UPI0039C3E30D
MMSLHQRCHIAEAIARRAGDVLLEARQHGDFGARLKRGEELVTDIDVQLDTMISQALEGMFPGEARLTEELAPEAMSRAQLEGPLWIVDPIDGTVNFAHGHAHVAVSIAWCHEGQPQVGVVHAPFLNETFTAIRGEGAWRNGHPIHCRQITRLDEALIATGFAYDRSARPRQLELAGRLLMQCRDLRRNGAAALDLCHVADGRLDGYFESVSPWDMAAGTLIAQEAGACFSHYGPVPDTVPDALYSRDMLVCVPALQASLTSLLAAQ